MSFFLINSAVFTTTLQPLNVSLQSSLIYHVLFCYLFYCFAVQIFFLSRKGKDKKKRAGIITCILCLLSLSNKLKCLCIHPTHINSPISVIFPLINLLITYCLYYTSKRPDLRTRCNAKIKTFIDMIFYYIINDIINIVIWQNELH